MAWTDDNDVRMYERLTPEQVWPLMLRTADFIEDVGLARGENVDDHGRHCLMAALNACAHRVVWYHSTDIALPVARWLARNRRDELVEALNLKIRPEGEGIVKRLSRDDGNIGFGHAQIACQYWNDAARDGVPLRSQEEVVAMLRYAAVDMSPLDEPPTV